MPFSRRSFLKTSVLAGSALTFPAASYGRIAGANDNLRVGVIGINSRGKNHIDGLKGHVVALCDCDEKILGRVAEEKKLDVERFIDYRKLCESKTIDAVSIATPNHTHSLIGITAAANGKHVYVEKPVSHNVWEGRQLANAVKKYNVVIQCGTQSRSSPSLKEAVKFVREGKLGKIKYAIGTCYKPRMSIGKLSSALQIPKHVNYDLWCGPAAKVDLYRPKLHYDWHWDFNTGNGDMGNQGIHQMDIGRWFLGYDTLSPRVLSIGGRLGYEDAGNTPNTQTVIHDYPDAPLVFETRGLPRTKAFTKKNWGTGQMDNYRGSRVGVIIQCENGYVVVPNYTSAKAIDNDNKEIKSWNGGGNHYKNFVASVEANDNSKLNAPVIDGHLSSALCHTGGLSHQLGKNSSLEEIKAALANESDIFKDSFKRMAQHLEANGVDIKDGKALTLGADLKMDVKSEAIVGNDKANSMLARECRPGFEVPNLMLKETG